MPKITALIHTLNHERVLGRALESLRPSDELLIVDHGSTDETLAIAREYGATIQRATTADAVVSEAASNEWLFCLSPLEALTEHLEASLFEWKLSDPAPHKSFAVELGEEASGHWQPLGFATRLVTRSYPRWREAYPCDDPTAPRLEGMLLRFRE